MVLLHILAKTKPKGGKIVDRFYVWYVWIVIYGIILGVKVKEIFRKGN